MIFDFGLVLFLFSTGLLVSGQKYLSGENTDMEAAIQFMHDIDAISDELCERIVAVEKSYKKNKTEENLNIINNLSKEYDQFSRDVTLNATKFAWKTLQVENPLAYRWFKSNALLGELALSDDKSKELNDIISNMTQTLSSAKVCNQTDDCETPTLAIYPDLEFIMTHSEDYDERQRVWKAYRDASGKLVRDKYFRYVELKNEAAVLNGFTDNGEYWREAYESETFQQDLAELWNRIKPLYQQLHAYARKKLMTKYPGKIKPGGPIPAHIIGNMLSQVWYPIYDLLKPYPNAANINVTSAMIAKGMTVRDIFSLADQFFISLGLLPATAEFWEDTIMEKPEGTDSHCNAYASAICNGKGLMVNICGGVNMDDLIIIHHEMGHIQYYMQYADQPLTFERGANPGFHEAVGDALALSVMSDKHLEKIGLLQESEETPEADLNFLMRMAMEKIAFLPFAYLMDLYRWQIFNGSITESNLNTKWWEMEQSIHGVCPPVRRTEEDFDAAALFHVVGDYPYIRYFISFIIQFQFHKALCKEIGYTGPLFKCDIYQNKAAGDLLSEVLSKGSSITWNEAMLILTRGETDKMDASGLLEYFQPLMEWLEQENSGQTIGWTPSEDPNICPTP